VLSPLLKILMVFSGVIALRTLAAEDAAIGVLVMQFGATGIRFAVKPQINFCRQ
jgi:hypothetical protein